MEYQAWHNNWITEEYICGVSTVAGDLREVEQRGSKVCVVEEFQRTKTGGSWHCECRWMFR